MNRVHLIFFVRDQTVSTRFYASVLRRAPDVEVPGMTEFILREGLVLGLMPEKGVSRLLGPALPNPINAQGIPRAELYLEVADPGACHARALSHGAREVSPLQPRPWGHVAAYSLDLDGHVLAFAAPTR